MYFGSTEPLDVSVSKSVSDYVMCDVCKSVCDVNSVVYTPDLVCPVCYLLNSHPRESVSGVTNNCIDLRNLKPQSDVIFDVRKILGNVRGNLDEYSIKLIEDIMVCLLSLTQCTTWKMLSLQLVTFIKFRSKNSLTNDLENILVAKFSELFADHRQFDGEVFIQMRGLFDHYDKFKDTPLFKKLHSFFMYCLTYQLLERFNVSFDSLCYSELEQNAIKLNFCNRASFLHCIVDTMTFILERGVQCFRLGKFDPMIHTSETYESWCVTVSDLKQRGQLMFNSDLHNIDRFAFEADLIQAIEKGDCIVKYTKMKSLERHFFLKELCDIKMLKSDLLTKRDALKRRRMPFGILINGPSNIGKTMFTEIVMTHFIKHEGLPMGDEFIYPMNEFKDHWDGFYSYMHTIIMDDIAKIRPNCATQGGDPSLKQVIQIMNEATLLPPMADLPDKGRNPVKVRFVAATTNKMDLNADHYFACPLAVRRRFPYIIDLRVKQEYSKGGMLNTDLVPVLDSNMYNDLWDIRVYEIIPNASYPNRASERLVQEFNDIYKFIVWYNEAIDTHNNKCDKKERAEQTVREVVLCSLCFLPTSVCKCSQSDGADIELDTDQMRTDQETTFSYPLEDLPPPDSKEWSDWIYDNTVYMVLYDWTIGLLWSYGIKLFWDYVCAGLFVVVNPLIAFIFTRYLWLATYMFLFSNILEVLLPGTGFKQRFIHYLLMRIDKRQFARFMGERMYNTIYKNQEKIKLQAILLTIASVSLILYSKYVRSPGEKKEKDYNEMTLDDIINHRRYLTPVELDRMDKCFTEEELEVIVNKEFELARIKRKEQSLFKEGSENRFLPTDMDKQFKVYIDEGRRPISQIKEKENMWVKDNYELTTFDLTPQITSTKISASDFLDKIKQNCVRLEFVSDRDDSVVVTATNALGICDQYYIMNAHALTPDFRTVRVIRCANLKGVTSNMEIILEQKYIKRYDDLDLAIIKILTLPNVSDIRKYFPSETYRGRHHGMYGLRRKNGSFCKKEVTMVREQHMLCFAGEIVGFTGYVDSPTVSGDCGSPLVVETPMGTMILGIHMMGEKNMVGCAKVSKQFLDSFFAEKKLISACAPQVSSESRSREICSLHYKSEVNFIEDGLGNVYGSFPSGFSKYKTRVECTPMSEYLLNYGFTIKYGAPIMKGWEPWRNGLLPLVTKLPHIDHKLLRVCRKAFVQEVLDLLPKEQLDYIHVLDDDTTVFGADGIAFLDRINMNSSAGNPWKKCKKFLFEETLVSRGMIDELQNRFDAIIDGYKSGKRYSPIFCMHMKDEPRSFKKIKDKLTRLFSGGPVDWILVQRKYLLAFVRVFQNNKFIFEGAPGVNAHSLEWTEIHDYMLELGENLIGGDFKNFDKTIQVLFMREAFKFMIAICKAAGYSKQSCLVLKGIMFDTIFAFTEFNGTLIEFFKGNPSGHSLTVIINCIILSLVFRYCFIKLHPNCSSLAGDHDMYILEFVVDYKKAFRILSRFKKSVKGFFYGDDNILSVSRECLWFNHTSIAEELALIGMEYTMADKDKESVPFISMKELSFLKRTWRYVSEIGAIVAPLEFESIEKMLMVWTRSKSISKEEQIFSILDSALTELFMHGEEIFTKHKFLFERMVDDLDLRKFQLRALPTWDLLFKRFWGKIEECETLCNNERAFEHMSCMKPESSVYHSYCSCKNFHCCLAERVDDTCVPPKRSLKSLFSERFGWNLQSDEYSVGIKVPAGFNDALNNLNKNKNRSLIADLRYMQKQSNTIMEFHDEFEGEMNIISHGEEPTQFMNYTELSSLKEFLARPTLIDTTTWLVGTSFAGVDIYPWQLFLNNVRIKKKLDNFNYLRGRLHVKIILSCSPFYYGLMQAAYRPYQGLTYNLEIANTDFMPFSQRPSIWMYPAENKGGEMVLPFFYNKDWVDISLNSNSGDLGRIKYIEYVPLQSANGVAVEDVTIQMYAWMEEVQLCGPTVSLALQSDEYTESPVGKVANTVAAISSNLEKAPIIGGFATATKTVANGVSQIASLFGFSDPPYIDVVQAFKSLPFHGMTSTDLSEPVSKLTLDSKSELSVDPSIVGLDGTDELDICYITGKYSYITQFTWSSTDTPTTMKYYCPVTPNMFNKQTAVATGVYPFSWTPSGHLSQLFANWRGGITYKITIIASKYHRGRLLFTWDPSGNLVTTSDTVNQAFTRLLDIGQSREYEITIPYLKDRPWLFTDYAADYNSLTNYFQTSSFTNTVNTRRHNGSISIRVQNFLLAPVTNAPIRVIISQKCADDFQFANPATSSLNKFTFFTPQSETIIEDKAAETVSDTIFDTTIDPRSSFVNFGDPVQSIRSLLRRATTVDLIAIPAGSAGNLYKSIIQHSRFPPFGGYNSNSPYLGTSSMGGDAAPYYWCAMTPYNWMFPCFVGQRGSLRWYYNIMPGGNVPVDSFKFSRDVNSVNGLITTDNATSVIPGGQSDLYIRGISTRGVSGQVVFNQRTQTGMAIEIPMQSWSRMYHCEVSSAWLGKTIDDSNTDMYKMEVLYVGQSSVEPMFVTRYFSIGTDFNFHFYLNAPSCYYINVTPSASL